MTALIVTTAAIAVALLLLAFYKRNADPQRAQEVNEAWASAQAIEASAFMKMLLSASKPLGALPQVHLDKESSFYRGLRRKLVGSGVYGGSVEVFLSMQVLACLIAAGSLLAAIGFGATGLPLTGVILLSAAFAGQPYSKMSSSFKKRSQEVITGLPEFAEMLLMPVSSGFGVLSALDFTAKRLSGPVAGEVRLMLQNLSSRTLSEKESFVQAGERLGASAAATFFNTLYQSYVEGTQIAESIRGQAEQLRILSYEATRAKLKTLPNKLVIIMGLHLLPFLFAVVLLPTFVSLGAMG